MFEAEAVSALYRCGRPGRRSIEAEASAARRSRAAWLLERANKATSQLLDQYEEEEVGGGWRFLCPGLLRPQSTCHCGLGRAGFFVQLYSRQLAAFCWK